MEKRSQIAHVYACKMSAGGEPITRQGIRKWVLDRSIESLSPKKLGIEYEKLKLYEKAASTYLAGGLLEDVERVRELVAKKGRVNIDQTIVKGDYVDDRDTIIKDSVLNRSNVGGSSSKMQELKELTEMKEKGLIDDDEFTQMKKEILGK